MSRALDAADLDEAVRDCLLNAEPWTGGPIGMIDPAHEEQVMQALKDRGLIGSRGGLTRKGASEARESQFEEWGA